jgi:hypothetical protein
MRERYNTGIKERKGKMRSDRTDKFKEWERTPGDSEEIRVRKRYKKKKGGVHKLKVWKKPSPLSFKGILHCISNSFTKVSRVSGVLATCNTMTILNLKKGSEVAGRQTKDSFKLTMPYLPIYRLKTSVRNSLDRGAWRMALCVTADESSHRDKTKLFPARPI